MQRVGKILVPVDFEAPSKRALDIALVIAAKFDSSVTLLHAYSLPVTPYMEGLTWPMEDLAAAAKVALDGELARGRARWARIDAALVAGHPGYAIIEWIKSRDDIDLVVMGTHGRRGLSRFLLGSVAEKTVRLSPVPVLTVPGEPGTDS